MLDLAMKTLADLLLDYREDTGTTREELADNTGLHINTISLIEQGKIWNIKVRTAVAIASAIDVTPQQVLTCAIHSWKAEQSR